MRKKIGSVGLYARKIIGGAILALVLIFLLGKLVMAQVCERIVPYGSPPDGSPPDKRNGHVLVSSPGGNEQYVFGGFDQDADLWILRYEGDTWRWENTDTRGADTPSERGGHSGIFVPEAGQDYVILFGGSQSFLSVPTDTCTYKLEKPWDWGSQWEILETTNTVPPLRAEHTAVYEFSESKMVVFGGYDNSSVASNTTFALDFSVTPASWTEVNILGDKPPARYGHSAAWTTMGIMVFGGKNESEEFFNDCWRLRLWDKDWEEMNVTGDEPPARWQHTAVYLDPSPGETGRMLIFGGQDENGEYLDDFWVLREPDYAAGEFNYRWEEIYPIGDLPSGRRGHAAGTGWGWMGERMVYIFGGYDGDENLNDIYLFFKGEEVKKSVEKKPFNAPNPFDPDKEDTKICYYLEDDENVKIKLFTLTGELVFSWENISGREGLNQWPWNGKNEKGRIVENGGYICLIEAGGKKQKCKIAVLR